RELRGMPSFPTRRSCDLLERSVRPAVGDIRRHSRAGRLRWQREDGFRCLAALEWLLVRDSEQQPERSVRPAVRDERRCPAREADWTMKYFSKVYSLY